MSKISEDTYENLWTELDESRMPGEAGKMDLTKAEASPVDWINPDHYKALSVEVIDMMVRIWGTEKVAFHCEMCAFKYRLRLGNKPDQPVDRDLEKARWYEAKSKELREGLQNSDQQ